MSPEKTEPDCEDEQGDTSALSALSGDGNSTLDSEREPYFEPVVCLPEVQVKTNEEDESELVKLRCKLFRYHNEGCPEWKERGTGDVKILRHNDTHTVRLLMRQDKTLKIRANHFITPYMELKPNCKSDRAWVWSVRADFADEEPKYETFAIRFANEEHASLFKAKFDEAKGIATMNKLQELANCIRTDETYDEDSSTESEKDAASTNGSKVEAIAENVEAESLQEEGDAQTDKVTSDLEKLSVATTPAVSESQ